MFDRTSAFGDNIGHRSDGVAERCARFRMNCGLVPEIASEVTVSCWTKKNGFVEFFSVVDTPEWLDVSWLEGFR